MNIPESLDFLAALCAQAESARRQGNRAPLLELGRHPATAHYFANVVKLATLSPQQWAAQFPQYVAQVDMLRLGAKRAASQALQLELQAGQIVALERQIDRLAAALRASSAARCADEDTVCNGG